MGRRQLVESEFYRDGLVVIRGAVSQRIVAAANATLGPVLDNDLASATNADIREWTQRSFVPSLGSHPHLLRLFTSSGLSDLCLALVAPFKLVPVETVQVQVRLGKELSPVPEQPMKNWHCDGVACPHLNPGELRTFQLLVGVLLTAVTSLDDGPVRFQTGGHHRLAEFFGKNRALPSTEEVPAELINDKETVFLGQPGDAVIAHHLVPHRVGANGGKAHRVMLYFRLKVEDHEDIARIQLKEPWVRMPSVVGDPG